MKAEYNVTAVQVDSTKQRSQGLIFVLKFEARCRDGRVVDRKVPNNCRATDIWSTCRRF